MQDVKRSMVMIYGRKRGWCDELLIIWGFIKSCLLAKIRKAGDARVNGEKGEKRQIVK